MVDIFNFGSFWKIIFKRSTKNFNRFPAKYKHKFTKEIISKENIIKSISRIAAYKTNVRIVCKVRMFRNIQYSLYYVLRNFALYK